MQKEVLTKEKIKHDYKKEFFKGITTVIIMPIVLTLLLFLIIFLFSLLKTPYVIYTILEIMIISCISFFIIIDLCVLYDSYKKLRLVYDNKFYITTDRLISSEEKVTLWGNSFLASFSKPYILCFKSYGRYCIPEGKNYHSFQTLSMSDKGVFNCSNIGDEFYVVIINDKNILLAYNTKLFDLQ